MGITAIIRGALPNASIDFFKRVEAIKQPRYMLAGDIDHWINLRGQINAATGRINSYRDIRKICLAEGATVPSLGTLRNYLGDGGALRHAVAKAEWLTWFEDFGSVTQFFKEELEYLTSKEDWETFREVYLNFMGFR